ncbi:MAG: tetratricopeptide repeat protein [Motiliproteus sp.]
MKKSIAVLQQWKNNAPNNPEAPHTMGLTYASKQRYSQALAEFDAALKINPKFIIATKSKADVYALKGNMPAAIEAYEGTISADPKYMEVYIRLGLLYYQKKDIAKAIDSFRRAIKIDPKYPVAYNDLAWVLAQEGKNMNEAMELAQTAVKLSPKYADAQDTLGLIYLRTSRYDDAIQVLKTAKQLRPNLTAALELNSMLQDAATIKKMIAEIR